MKKILFVLFALFTFSSLMAKKPGFQLSYGSGGGFTGLSTTYTISSDGTFSKEDNVSHKKESLEKVKCKDIKEIRKLIAAVNFSTLNINKTGNITSFVILVQDGKESKAQWTGSITDNAPLDSLNKKLISLIPHK
jgi:hypothetical protein